MAEVPKDSLLPKEEDYPSNAHKYRKEDNKPANDEAESKDNKPSAPKKNLSGNVTSKPRSFGKQFIDIFFRNGASPKEIRKYIVEEMIIPAILENIADTITTAVEMRFFGESGRSSRRNRKSNSGSGSRVNYGGYFVGNDDRRDRSQRSARDRSYQEPLDDFIFDDSKDAEMVLVDMQESLERYPAVTVADYIDLLKQYGVKVRDAEHTDSKYGWTDLSEVKVRRARGGGYYIDLPREYPI